MTAGFHNSLRAPVFSKRWKNPEDRRFFFFFLQEGRIAILPAVERSAVLCPSRS